MSRKRVRSLSPTAPGASDPECRTFRSAAIKDRSSTFIAIFSPTAPARNLQAHPDFQTATHRIAAWRKPSCQCAVFSTAQPLVVNVGHDDNGEKYGGKRLEKVLTEMNVEGAVVVARWYGGTLLGPTRFTHIENCAREAIGKWKMSFAASEGRGGGGGEGHHHVGQKRRVQVDEQKRPGLLRVLEERDHSILALRGLLRQKSEVSAQEVGRNTAGARGEIGTPDKAVNYSAMPLPTLERLEKAKDATISWILREIEKVEEEHQQQKAGNHRS